MATYYISARLDGEEVVFAMNATLQSRLNTSGELSQFRLENGNTISDNYRSLPDTISLSGVISDVVVQGGRNSELKPTREYIEGLQRLKSQEIPFTVHYASDLSPKYPCFFTDLSISQDSENGYAGYSSEAGRDINSYKISANIQVARLGRIASIELTKASEFIDPTTDKSTVSSATKEISAEDPVDRLMVDGISQTILGGEQAQESAQGVNQPGGG